MEGLYKRGNIFWMRFRYNGERVHETTGHTDLAMAKAALAEKKRFLMTAERDANLGRRKTMKVGEAIDLVEVEYFQQTKNAQPARCCLGVIKDYLGDMDITKVDVGTAKSLKAHLRKRGVKEATMDRYISFLNRTLTHANEEHGVDCLPRITGVRSKAVSHRIRVISADEEQRVREWFRDHKIIKRKAGWDNQDLVEIFDFLMNTGMRRGEAFGFRVADVRDGMIILVDHKTAAHEGERSVPLNKTARRLVDARIARLGLTPSDHVFPYSKHAFTTLWQRMRKGVGLGHDDNFVVHAIRHTFASRLAAKGATIYHVSKLLGHSTVKTTERYAHLFTADLTRTAELLDAPEDE